MWEVGPEAKFHGAIFILIAVFSDVIPNFSFRQLPRATVSTYIVQFRRHDMRECVYACVCVCVFVCVYVCVCVCGGPGSKVPIPLFSLNCSSQRRHAQF